MKTLETPIHANKAFVTDVVLMDEMQQLAPEMRSSLQPRGLKLATIVPEVSFHGDDEMPGGKRHMAPAQGKISTLAAWAHLLKAVMGAGSFALPWAFLQAGVVLGPLLMVSVCALSAYTHILLVRCRREASSRAGDATNFCI